MASYADAREDVKLDFLSGREPREPFGVVLGDPEPESVYHLIAAHDWTPHL